MDIADVIIRMNCSLLAETYRHELHMYECIAYVINYIIMYNV